tara:strand:- start:1086 stop:1568 length:483 start_codon:yes stop_codon:yes gene_type:complete
MWKVKKSKIHSSGVFATNDINKKIDIIEYRGEKITKKEGDVRSEKRIKKYLDSSKTGSVYIFELNSKYDVDGTPLYNKARYINHSCNPNCEVEIKNKKIWITSKKYIKNGDELTYDYGYPFDPEDYSDHKCVCGSKNCIGYIISKDDRKKFKRFLSNNKK